MAQVFWDFSYLQKLWMGIWLGSGFSQCNYIALDVFNTRAKVVY